MIEKRLPASLPASWKTKPPPTTALADWYLITAAVSSVALGSPVRGVTAGAAFVLVSAVRIVARRARAVEQVAQPVVLLVGIGLRRRLATGLDRNPLRAALAGIEGSFCRLVWGASLVAAGLVCAHEPCGRQQLRDARGLIRGDEIFSPVLR